MFSRAGFVAFRCPAGCLFPMGAPRTWITSACDRDGMPPAAFPGDERCDACGADGEWMPDLNDAMVEIDL
jgi:hypothetical protein